MSYFTDVKYLINTLCAKDVLKLVIITANGKRVLKEIYWNGRTAEITELIFSDMGEWENVYRFKWSTFCKMIEDKKILAYYWKN